MATPDPDAGGDNPIELKGRMTTVMVLRLLSPEVDTALRALDGRLAEAPGMFAGLPLALDLDALDPLPDATDLGSLVAALRQRGLVPVALGGEREERPGLAAALGLGLIRAGAVAGGDAPRGERAAAPPRRERPREPEAVKPAAPETAAAAARIITQPVRSGQQIYARGDLIVLATVSPGAEVLADGCIHVYGALNGRALAGVQGDRSARIFCREFNAELVAIAGHYQISEHIGDGERGREMMIALDGDSLTIRPLAGG